MRIEQAAGQVLVTGFIGSEAPKEILQATHGGLLGGVLLFRRNLESPAQTAELIAQIVDSAPGEHPPLVAVDQEGGRVARLGAPILELPPARALGEIDEPDLTRRAAGILGKQLRLLGFNADFAPVLDVDTRPNNPVIGDRAFGSEVSRVICHAGAFSDGLTEAGVLSCGKHFPGHGDTELDSHLALPRVKRSRAELEATELAPFAALAQKLPMLMTAHVIYDALEPNVPATLSKVTLRTLLRGRMGFRGIVVSDDLQMQAIADHYTTGEAACAAIEAGCDVLLPGSTTEHYLEARQALSRRAESDPWFRDRLQDAAQRFGQLRRRHCASPETCVSTLDEALAEVGAQDIAGEIAARLAQIGSR